MSKETQDSFIRELQVLDHNNEVHAAQVHQIEKEYQVTTSKRPQKQCEECYSIQNAYKATISFSKEDMLLGNVNHTRPLYFTAYIKEVPIPRVQVDPGSALNLITITALQELGVPPNKLTSTNTTIQGYDGEVQKPIGKIRIKFQLGSLAFEATLHVVKTQACYNILLRRRWLHDYTIVPSTLHHCFKFIDNDGKVHRVFANKKPFKGKKVYFTDATTYEERKPSVKKPIVETSTTESSKAMGQQQKKKLVVRFANTLEPLKIKVKPDMKKSKHLIISAKSSKLVNVASPVNRLDQEIPWSDLL